MNIRIKIEQFDSYNYLERSENFLSSNIIKETVSVKWVWMNLCYFQRLMTIPRKESLIIVRIPKTNSDWVSCFCLDEENVWHCCEITAKTIIVSEDMLRFPCIVFYWLDLVDFSCSLIIPNGSLHKRLVITLTFPSK